MKKIDLGQTLTILANVSVLAGLIFVGFQLQQDREIAVASLQQDRIESLMYWAELIEEQSDLWVKALAGEPLTITEEAEFDALATAREGRMWVSYMNAQGLMGSDSERSVRAWALELNQNPGLMSWWRNYQAESQYVNQNPVSLWADEIDAELNRLSTAPSGEPVVD